jgi:hypothetical protein
MSGVEKNDTKLPIAHLRSALDFLIHFVLVTYCPAGAKFGVKISSIIRKFAFVPLLLRSIMLIETKITKDTIAPEERNNFILQTSEA